MKYVILLHLIFAGYSYDVSLQQRYQNIEECQQIAEHVVIPTVQETVPDVYYSCIIKDIEQKEVWL